MDTFTKKKRSWIMSRIRSTGTKPEQILLEIARKHFYRKGYRYRKHYSKLKGRPDIAFVKQKVAVFADGHFWHGYQYKKWINKIPKKYWQAKIKGNTERDKKINSKLKKQGWVVLRFWEHELENKQKVASKIQKILNKKVPIYESNNTRQSFN